MKHYHDYIDLLVRARKAEKELEKLQGKYEARMSIRVWGYIIAYTVGMISGLYMAGGL